MTNQTHTTTGIVIGYGSVGRRHAASLESLVPQLTIVEQDADARDRAQQAHPEAHIVATLEDLDKTRIDWATTMAVIATWGPSHAAFFHSLADRGVRRVLCEKPMASSVADAAAMVARAEAEGIALAVHHYIRYAGLVPALESLAARHELGPPVALMMQGGAACLLTNGIHWLDCACELFNATPETTISTAYGDAINPRSPTLQIYGGTMVWRFAERREAVISFTNASSVATQVRIYYRDAVADIDSDLHVRLLRRNQEAVARYPAVTRTGPASELLFEGMAPGMRPYLEGMRVAQDEVLHNGPLTCPGILGAQAVEGSIGALIAAREKYAVMLPIDRDSLEAQEHWPIS